MSHPVKKIKKKEINNKKERKKEGAKVGEEGAQTELIMFTSSVFFFLLSS